MSAVRNGMNRVPGAGPSPAAGSLHRASSAYSLIKLWLLGILHVAVTSARPLVSALVEEEEPKSPDDPGLYVYLGVAVVLVLLGGVFAGLTIALMGQDEIYLQVIASSGEGSEKKNAAKVLRLLKRGKHWVLVTLLVGNVITNETLPIVLDASIGGGYIAVITSTALVIVFGEIVPQSACVRYGLPIGAWCANFVLLLMWVLSPVSWPIAKLLDYLLGEDHGTVYKKQGLKTLVQLHQTMGTSADRLNEDEVAIIRGVLDLKAKSVGSIMTPMKDVFTLSTEAVLDEDMIDIIEREGYSRIPIHDPNRKGDFLGMLLVKMLITYDPEDAKKISDFSLATLPETRPETSCLDIINFFQEGKSHMVLVSDFPGEAYGALGVVTLEDVIEELIGEEIIDESDVFIDVHKAIRRMQPAPTHRTRIPKGEVFTDTDNPQKITEEDQQDPEETKVNGHREDSSTNNVPKRLSVASTDLNRVNRPATFLVRRRTSLGSPTGNEIQKRQYDPELREHLKHLGPSNAANKPRPTRVNTVKIKPGNPTGQDAKANASPSRATGESRGPALSEPPQTPAQDRLDQDFISPGRGAKDGVLAMRAGQQDYGTTSNRPRNDNTTGFPALGTDDQGVQVPTPPADGRGRADVPSIQRTGSHSTLGDYSGPASRSMSHRRGQTRSGSITEQFVESGGVRKLVLEMTSSSEAEEEHLLAASANPSRGGSKPTSMRGGAADHSGEEEGPEDAKGGGSKKKKRRHRRKKPKADGASAGEGGSENTPLLGQ